MDGSSFALLLEFLTHPVFVGAVSIFSVGILLTVFFSIIQEKAKSEFAGNVGFLGTIFSAVGLFVTLLAFLIWGINL